MRSIESVLIYVVTKDFHRLVRDHFGDQKEVYYEIPVFQRSFP